MQDAKNKFNGNVQIVHGLERLHSLPESLWLLRKPELVLRSIHSVLFEERFRYNAEYRFDNLSPESALRNDILPNLTDFVARHGENTAR